MTGYENLHHFHQLNQHAIASIRPSPVSLMPDGLITHLTQQELADRLAFLRAQK
jgi:hypothetical protein